MKTNRLLLVTIALTFLLAGCASTVVKAGEIEKITLNLMTSETAYADSCPNYVSITGATITIAPPADITTGEKRTCYIKNQEGELLLTLPIEVLK